MYCIFHSLVTVVIFDRLCIIVYSIVIFDSDVCIVFLWMYCRLWGVVLVGILVMYVSTGCIVLWMYGIVYFIVYIDVLYWYLLYSSNVCIVCILLVSMDVFYWIVCIYWMYVSYVL